MRTLPRLRASGSARSAAIARVRNRADCACAVGDWTLDTAEYKAMPAAMAGNDGRVDAITGAAAFTFGADGAARFTATAFTARITPFTGIKSRIAATADEG